MIRIHPTSDTGRTVEIDTPFLKATIIDGEVAVWEPRTPPAPNAERTAARATTCRACPHGGDKAVRVDARLARVKCGATGRCGNVSLVNGRCPIGAWHNDQPPTTE